MSLCPDVVSPGHSPAVSFWQGKVAVLKDLNLIQRKQCMHVDSDTRAALLRQIELDVYFLPVAAATHSRHRYRSLLKQHS